MANRKSVVETLLEAYNLGETPLVLIIVGFSVLTAGSIFEGFIDLVPGVNPTLIFLIGTVFILFGSFMWVFKVWLRHKLHVAMISALGELLQGAGNAAKMGSDFKVALEEALPEFPNVLKAITEQEKPI